MKSVVWISDTGMPLDVGAVCREGGWQVSLVSTTDTIPPATAYILSSELPDLDQAVAKFRKTEAPVLIATASDCTTEADDILYVKDGPPPDLIRRLNFALQKKLNSLEIIRRVDAEQARAATAIAQREEFLSVCAHDLRSPLGLIQSSLGMLLKRYGPKLDTLQTEIVTRAQRQATQGLALVHDLLDVMALEQGLRPQYQVVELHSLLSEFHKDFGFQATQKGIRLHYENPVPAWRVLMDPDRIRQMMQNLMVNALKFTAEGKNIYLRITPFQGRRKTDPPFPMLVLSLQDEGRGIPESELQKIFDRFTQVKTNQRPEGRGLGLTVAKQISTLHDGNLWVQSQEGNGTTFFALLPHVINQWELTGGMDDTRRKVLVAEPQLERRPAYSDAFKGWNADVLFARDGIEALTMLFHSRPRLLILSPHLDKLGEREIAEILKANPSTASIPILYATSDPGGTKDARPFDAVLPLPCDQHSIEDILAGVQLKVGTGKKAA